MKKGLAELDTARELGLLGPSPFEVDFKKISWSEYKSQNEPYENARRKFLEEHGWEEAKRRFPITWEHIFGKR